MTTIGADATASFDYSVVGEQRGFYPIGPVQITLGDFFGIAHRSITGKELSYLTIFPRVCSVPPLRLPSNRLIGGVSSTKRIYEDATRIVGVRDYLPGDTFSMIHWKTTARTGNLVSKLCEPSSTMEVNLLLNLHASDYQGNEELVDLACTTVASVAESLLADRHLIGMYSNGEDPIWNLTGKTHKLGVVIRPDKDETQRMAILSTLGRLQCSTLPALPHYLEDIRALMAWTALLMVITPMITAESAMVLESLKQSGFALAVIVIGEGEHAESARICCTSLNIPMADVPTEKHLAQLDFRQPGRS